MRAAIYARYSSENQRESSLPRRNSERPVMLDAALR